MAQRRGFPRVRSQRRLTSWGLGPGDSSPEPITGSGKSVLGLGAGAVVDGLTVVRLRGSVQAYIDSFNAAGSGFHCAMGVCVANGDAFATGVAALPDPLADASWDGWMYHRFFDVHAITSTISDGVNGYTIQQEFEVDSKAMRKLPASDVLCAVIDVVEIGTATMDVFFDSRILLKLP